MTPLLVQASPPRAPDGSTCTTTHVQPQQLEQRRAVLGHPLGARGQAQRRGARVRCELGVLRVGNTRAANRHGVRGHRERKHTGLCVCVCVCVCVVVCVCVCGGAGGWLRLQYVSTECRMSSARVHYPPHTLPTHNATTNSVLPLPPMVGSSHSVSDCAKTANLLPNRGHPPKRPMKDTRTGESGPKYLRARPASRPNGRQMAMSSWRHEQARDGAAGRAAAERCEVVEGKGESRGDERARRGTCRCLRESITPFLDNRNAPTLQTHPSPHRCVPGALHAPAAGHAHHLRTHHPGHQVRDTRCVGRLGGHAARLQSEHG